MKTATPKKADQKQKWYLIDAKDQVMGRLATRIANILRGKDKPLFSPHMDCGDFVVVINADQVKLTSTKRYTKKYYSHSGFPGGLKEATADELFEKHPTKPLELAVRGMLPKNRLRKHFMTKLKLYTGEEHPHDAQQPKKIEL